VPQEDLPVGEPLEEQAVIVPQVRDSVFDSDDDQPEPQQQHDLVPEEVKEEFDSRPQVQEKPQEERKIQEVNPYEILEKPVQPAEKFQRVRDGLCDETVSNIAQQIRDYAGLIEASEHPLEELRGLSHSLNNLCKKLTQGKKTK